MGDGGREAKANARPSRALNASGQRGNARSPASFVPAFRSLGFPFTLHHRDGCPLKQLSSQEEV